MTWGPLASGTAGLVLSVAVAWVAVIAGLHSAHASRQQLLLSPVLAMGVALVVLCLHAIATALLDRVGFSSGTTTAARWVLPALLVPLAGFVAGRRAGRVRGEGVVRRGAQILDGAAGAAVRRRLEQRSGAAGLTIAGVQIPGEDETKHFKLIGTTGT